MDVLDIRNKKIQLGSQVKYVGTNAHGIVEDICIKKGVPWVLIDSTNLYYLSNYLEVVNYDVKVKSRYSSKKDFKKNLLKRKIIKDAFSTEISDHGDGPGYGGGK
ncbi:MAG: DUF2098 family protein [Methanomicrobiales archaeon]